MSSAKGHSYPLCVLASETPISAKWRCCGSWWTCVRLEVAKKEDTGTKLRPFLSLTLSASHPGWVDSFQADSCCVPKCVHVTRSWHNRPTSFVSWAYNDTVHYDLSLNNMCWCHGLSFVAGVFLKGAQSFQRALWHRLTLWFFVCVLVCVHAEMAV